MRQGDEELKATLWTWQEDHDLAVLVIARPNAPKLDWASANPPVKLGDRVFAVSGLGAGGGAISQGFVADVSAQGIQHDAAVGAAFQGGPLVDSDGHVVAVASRAYAPLGFDPGTVTWGVPIRSSCDNDVIVVASVPVGLLACAILLVNDPVNPPKGVEVVVVDSGSCGSGATAPVSQGPSQSAGVPAT